MEQPGLYLAAGERVGCKRLGKARKAIDRDKRENRDDEHDTGFYRAHDDDVPWCIHVLPTFQLQLEL